MLPVPDVKVGDIGSIPAIAVVWAVVSKSSVIVEANTSKRNWKENIGPDGRPVALENGITYTVSEPLMLMGIDAGSMATGQNVTDEGIFICTGTRERSGTNVTVLVLEPIDVEKPMPPKNRTWKK